MEFTIKQIADEVGVSKTAVQKKIANLGLQKKLVKNGNKFLIDENTAKQVISAFKENNVNKNNNNEFANQNNNELLKVIEILQTELESKNRQIEDLTKALEHTTESLQASQALHAGTMQKQLSEGSIEQAEQQEQKENEKKQGFWSRLFHR